MKLLLENWREYLNEGFFRRRSGPVTADAADISNEIYNKVEDATFTSELIQIKIKENLPYIKKHHATQRNVNAVISLLNQAKRLYESEIDPLLNQLTHVRMQVDKGAWAWPDDLKIQPFRKGKGGERFSYRPSLRGYPGYDTPAETIGEMHNLFIKRLVKARNSLLKLYNITAPRLGIPKLEKIPGLMDLDKLMSAPRAEIPEPYIPGPGEPVLKGATQHRFTIKDED